MATVQPFVVRQFGAGKEARPLVGSSPQIQQIRKDIARAAKSDATVLISGETGAGKDLVAEHIHAQSNRARSNFVSVNCGGLNEGVVESLLFGHERGSFTGANDRQLGFFELADNGTLFLNEIADMPLAQQRNLLDTIERGRVRRIGGKTEIAVNVRVIAAANQDLENLQFRGLFRQDLFHRLSVLLIDVPSLAQRRHDVPELALHLAGVHAHNFNVRTPEFSKEALDALQAYTWPGNIRELSNTIERAVVGLDDGQTIIGIDDVVFDRKSTVSFESFLAVRLPAWGMPLEAIERQAIVEALKKCQWRQKAAADFLSISARVMNYKIKQHGIQPPPDVTWRKNSG